MKYVIRYRYSSKSDTEAEYCNILELNDEEVNTEFIEYKLSKIRNASYARWLNDCNSFYYKINIIDIHKL